MALAYLIDPQNQYMTKSGTINVGGVLRVYDAATDDAAVTYCDFGGTENEESIVLDNNGRAVVIADSDKAYRVEVYDRYGTLMWTTTPIWCLAGGGGVTLKVTEIVSSDGSIAVDKTTVGSTITFDLTIAQDNASELLEWVKCGLDNVSDGYVYPNYAEGTMETFLNKGLQVFGNRYYHVTSHFKVTPTGNGINYDTVSVALMFSVEGGSPVELCRRDFDVDNSLNDTLTYEFAFDFINEVDGYLYWSVTGASMVSQLDCTMQAHRVYSGINAVPGSIASKVWVNQQISSKIDYSALGYNSDNKITAINGSALGGGGGSGVDPTQFIPWSASGSFQPSGDYAFNSSLSSKLDASASSQFAPSGDYAFNSALSGKLDYTAFSTVSGTFLTAVPSSYATESYVDSAVSSKLDVTASSQFLTSLPDDLAYTSDVASAVSSKMDKSESSSFYPMDSNPAGYLTAHQSLAGYATVEYVDSAVSAKLDASAYDSAWFQPASSMSSWIPYSALDYSGTAISGIGGSSLAGMGGGGGADYSGVAPVNVDNDTRLISVDHRTLCVDDSLSAYNSGNSAVIGVKEAWLSSVINEVISGYIPYSALGHVEI